MREYVYLIRPMRAGFAEGPTPRENEVMSRHFEYLKDLHSRGTLLLAGPCLDTTFGVSIFLAESDEEAQAVMQNDPAVRDGVMSPELHEFRVSLFQAGYSR
jgi:uncharacterized protein